MKFRILVFIFCLPLPLLAQYTTPNTGLTYTLDDLVTLSDGVVTGDGAPDLYRVTDTLIVSALDTLQIFANPTVEIAPDVLITIQGAFDVMGNAHFTHIPDSADYAGFRFESESVVNMEGPVFEYGGGLRALTGNLKMVDCIVRYQSAGASTGAALGLSTGKPLISNCTFLENAVAAIGSAANSDAAPSILNCTLTGNSTLNENRPQINLGPSGTDTTLIINNTVVGNSDNTMAGGIAISALVGGECYAVISGNEVRDNRYGIAAIGNGITTLMEGNVIENNNTQGDPLSGGSGININASADNSHVILANQIRGNLWGITLQGNGMANLGELDNEEIGTGGNVFSNNGNNGEIFALYNNTPNTINAQGNCWLEDSLTATLDDVENVIFHQNDDPTLGEVIYDENLCGPTGIAELRFNAVANIYPNPTSATIRVELSERAENISIIDMRGRLLMQKYFGESLNMTIDLSDLAPGMYMVHVNGKTFSTTGRVVVE